MIKTEFDIIDKIDKNADYSFYEPSKYSSVYIDVLFIAACAFSITCFFIKRLRYSKLY